jgi:hypothetical protein
MRFAIKRSILFCLLLLLMCAGSSVYIVTLMNKGNVGHWTINISYYALQSGILIGGALAGVFVALGFSHPKRPLSVVGTVALAVLYFFFASLMLGLILQKVGPYLSCLAEAVLAYLLIRYPGRASLEPIYRRLEGHSQILKPLAFIGVPLSLAILDLFARGLAARWPEPILALIVWAILVALCVGIGSISIAILVPSSRIRRIIWRLSYIGGMLALALLVASPGFFLTERYQDTESRLRFFPKLADNPKDRLKDYWYAMYLTALRERPLCCNSSGSAEVYRFTWLRTFHHPVVIGLEHDLKGRWLMHTKVSSGAGGYEPGILGLDLVRSISSDDTRQLRDTLSVNSTFWNTEAQNSSVGFDGAEWIIESRVGDNYHFVDRWTPRNGLIHDIGLQFLALSGADFDPVY